jgi:hypothetical protein
MDKEINRGVVGPSQSRRKTYGPQQTIAQPPRGYVPPLENMLNPIGVYNSATGYWVGLPFEAISEQLVLAEQLHILGNLDGLVEDSSLQTITVPAGTVAGTVITETLTVPSGEVWFINAVIGTCLADGTGTIQYNWRCSLFEDEAGSTLGGLYHTNWLPMPLGPQYDEFSSIATLFTVGNKPVPLRLPPGATISGQLMNAAGAAAATGVVGTFALYGWKGKYLLS